MYDMCLFVFFKQKTAYEMRISDWSSDVCSSDLHAACGHACADRGAGAELGTAGDDAAGDAGPEDAVADQRQCSEHDRHCFVDGRGGAAEAGCEFGKERRADADDDAEHQHLDAGRDDVAERSEEHTTELPS